MFTCNAFARSITISLATGSLYLMSAAMASNKSPPWNRNKGGIKNKCLHGIDHALLLDFF